MTSPRPRVRKLRQVVLTWLALVLLGCAVFVHDHHTVQPGHERGCSACVLGQAAGVEAAVVAPEAAPALAFVVPPLPAAPRPRTTCVLADAPKTDPPRA